MENISLSPKEKRTQPTSENILDSPIANGNTVSPLKAQVELGIHLCVQLVDISENKHKPHAIRFPARSNHWLRKASYLVPGEAPMKLCVVENKLS